MLIHPTTLNKTTSQYSTSSQQSTSWQGLKGIIEKKMYNLDDVFIVNKLHAFQIPLERDTEEAGLPTDSYIHLNTWFISSHLVASALIVASKYSFIIDRLNLQDSFLERWLEPANLWVLAKWAIVFFVLKISASLLEVSLLNTWQFQFPGLSGNLAFSIVLHEKLNFNLQKTAALRKQLKKSLQQFFFNTKTSSGTELNHSLPVLSLFIYCNHRYACL